MDSLREMRFKHQKLLSYCPICKSSKPFQCFRCNKRISGPLQQGIGIVRNQAQCSGCATESQHPRKIISPLPVPKAKPRYDRYFNSAGKKSPNWYAHGYDRGYNDAVAGRPWAVQNHIACTYYGLPGYELATGSQEYQDLTSGYNDGFRAGHL